MSDLFFQVDPKHATLVLSKMVHFGWNWGFLFKVPHTLVRERESNFFVNEFTFPDVNPTSLSRVTGARHTHHQHKTNQRLSFQRHLDHQCR